MGQSFQKIIYTVLIILHVQASLFAQKRFEPAIIITLAGDTLRGEVNNRDWANEVSSITFRDTIRGVEKEYSIAQLESFRFVNGDYFVSRLTQYHYYTNDIDELRRAMDTIVTNKTMMLRVLYKGKASLYTTTDRKGFQHFFIEMQGLKTDELLEYKKAVFNSTGAPSLITVERYKQSLSYYLNDCPAVSGQIKSVAFLENQLKKLFENYNRCIAPADSNYVVVEEKSKVRYGILAGVSNTSFEFTSDISFDLANAKFPASTDIMAGFFFNILMPHKFQRLAVCNNFLLKKFYTSATSTSDYYYGPPSDNRNYFFDLTYFKIATTFNVDLTNTAVRPYIKVGMINSFIISQKTHIPLTALGTIYSTDYLRNHEQGLTVAIGVRKDHFLFEASAETGNGIEDLTGVNSSSKTFNFLVGYSFN